MKLKNVVFKENGRIIRVLPLTDELSDELSENSAHLCWDCSNAYANKCRKVSNADKKPIDEYDFITDGYQVVSKNGKVDSFIVTACKNFEKDAERKYTQEDRKKFTELRKGIKALYFEAETIEEADEIEARMLENKQLVKYSEKKEAKNDLVIEEKVKAKRYIKH